MEGSCTVIIVQALMELVLRQTITLRDRFVFVHVLRHSEAEADARFGSAAYGEHRARVVLAEMVSEYACIVLAPAIVLLYYPFRMLHNFGYTPGTDLNVLELLLGAALQLGFEFLVDLLCIRVEEREDIPVLRSWHLCGQSSTMRRRVYVWALAASITAAYFFMTLCFRFNIPSECMPYPCHQCVANGSGGKYLSAKGSAAEIVIWCTEHFPNTTQGAV